MVPVLKKVYWSKADAFLLPLTGLQKSNKYEVNSFLFWEEYSISNYNLILQISSENYDQFIMYCRNEIFPILDQNGYLVENYDCGSYSIFVLDLSEWALDIEMFLKGKYSRFSREAKSLIEIYHDEMLNKGKDINLPIHIYASIYPSQKPKILNGLTCIEYVAENYGFDFEDLSKIAELGGIYDNKAETLNLICRNDSILI